MNLWPSSRIFLMNLLLVVSRLVSIRLIQKERSTKKYTHAPHRKSWAAQQQDGHYMCEDDKIEYRHTKLTDEVEDYAGTDCKQEKHSENEAHLTILSAHLLVQMAICARQDAVFKVVLGGAVLLASICGAVSRINVYRPLLPILRLSGTLSAIRGGACFHTSEGCREDKHSAEIPGS